MKMLTAIPRGAILAFFCVLALAPVQSLYAQSIRVITTIPDLADIAQQIGKELVHVESLARGVEYMHNVPIKPSFVPKLNRADLVILMGLDLEASWLPALLEVSNNSKILPGQRGYVDSSAGISVLETPASVDRAEGDVHPKGNPHYNLDPVNGKTIARNIAEGLARNFPQHRHAFEKNLQAYLAELDRWIARWQEMALPLKGIKYVPYHNEWVYFAKRFGLQEVGRVEPKPGIEPPPSHVVNLAQTIKKEKAQVILYGAQSDRIPRQLAAQTGVKVLRLPTMAGGRAEVDSYIKLIDHSISALVAALKGV